MTKGVIVFRIDDENKQKIIEIAKAQGLDSASFCRSIILQKIKSNEVVSS